MMVSWLLFANLEQHEDTYKLFKSSRCLSPWWPLREAGAADRGPCTFNERGVRNIYFAEAPAFHRVGSLLTWGTTGRS